MKKFIFIPILFSLLMISVLSFYKKDIDSYIVNFINKNESLKTFLVKA